MMIAQLRPFVRWRQACNYLSSNHQKPSIYWLKSWQHSFGDQHELQMIKHGLANTVNNSFSTLLSSTKSSNYALLNAMFGMRELEREERKVTQYLYLDFDWLQIYWLAPFLSFHFLLAKHSITYHASGVLYLNLNKQFDDSKHHIHHKKA